MDPFFNYDEFQTARAVLRSYDPTKIVDNNCAKCAANPKISDSIDNLCILCHPRGGTQCGDCKKCSGTCEYCQRTQDYLIHSDSIFSLIGYERYYGSSTEFWKCSLCRQCLEFQCMEPGLQRDILHVTGRQNHLKYVCREFCTGQYSH